MSAVVTSFAFTSRSSINPAQAAGSDPASSPSSGANLVCREIAGRLGVIVSLLPRSSEARGDIAVDDAFALGAALSRHTGDPGAVFTAAGQARFAARILPNLL